MSKATSEVSEVAEEFKQHDAKMTPWESKKTQLKAVGSSGLYWLLCLFATIAVSRNFAGGYELTRMALPKKIPKWALITLQSMVGALVAYSPLTQIRNSIDKVWEMFATAKKPRDIWYYLLIILSVGLGVGAGLSFAQMGASAFNTMITDDWGIDDTEKVDQSADAIFIFTFIAQSILYTEKVYNLKLKSNNLIKIIRERPLVSGPLFFLDSAISGFAVVTNQKFGAQASAIYLHTSEIGSETLGTLCATGPASMCVIDNYEAVKFLRSHKIFSRKKLFHTPDQTTQLLPVTEQPSSPADEEKILVSWKFVMFALIMSMIACLANFKFNMDANGTDDSWGIFLLCIGTLVNILTKFISMIEKEHRLQLAKISQSPTTTLFNGHGRTNGHSHTSPTTIAEGENRFTVLN